MAQQAASARPRPSAPEGISKAQATRALTVSLYLAPAMVGMFLINVVPILYNAYMSLTNRNGPARFAEGKYRVTGFENYLRLLSQSDFYIVFGKTVLYAFVCVALFFVVGLAFALVLNNSAIKGKTVWRTLMILPWAVPTWITALIWKFLFHGQFGPINQILATVGIPGPDWLLASTTAWVAIIVVNIWMSYPFFMLILLGGLQSIPTDVYEAASIDGASYWKQLFSITLPLLRPVAIPAVILSVMTQFTMHFNTIWLMTKGGPVTRVGQPGATELLLVWGYNQGFQQQRFGLTSAFAIVVFLLLIILTVIYSRVTNATRGVYE